MANDIRGLLKEQRETIDKLLKLLKAEVTKQWQFNTKLQEKGWEDYCEHHKIEDNA